MEGGARIGRERVEAAGVFASGAARGPQLRGTQKRAHGVGKGEMFDGGGGGGQQQ